MAVKEIKDMGASVLTRLKKQAKETGINYQTCLYAWCFRFAGQMKIVSSENIRNEYCEMARKVLAD